jgi:hypothetical protein
VKTTNNGDGTFTHTFTDGDLRAFIDARLQEQVEIIRAEQDAALRFIEADTALWIADPKVWAEEHARMRRELEDDQGRDYGDEQDAR